MAPENIILIISGSFLAVCFASWKLNRDVQPLRRELIMKADILLSRPGLPDDVRLLVEDDARTVFGVRARLLFGIIAAPVIALLFLFRRRLLSDMRSEVARMAPDDRELFREVCALHDRITFVNHLILYPLFELELMVLMLFVIPARALLRSSVDMPGSADVVRDAVEHPRYRLHRPAAGAAC